MKLSNSWVKGFCVLAVFASSLSISFADADPEDCPKDPDPGNCPDEAQTPCDPAFAVTDTAPQIGLLHQKVLLAAGITSAQKPAGLVDAEKKSFEGYLETIKKSPSLAFDEAVTFWTGNASPDLQRLVVLNALPLVRSSDQSGTLQFMLKALEKPDVELTECARLARGNSLERSIAAKRIAILEGNARLRELNQK